MFSERFEDGARLGELADRKRAQLFGLDARQRAIAQFIGLNILPLTL
jgi:hypothetical protein